jgi:hypothetical protein
VKSIEGIAEIFLKNAKVKKEGSSVLKIEYDMQASATAHKFIVNRLKNIKDVLQNIKDHEELQGIDQVKFVGLTSFEYSDGREEYSCGIELKFAVERIREIQNFKNMDPKDLVKLQSPCRTGTPGAIRRLLDKRTLKLLYPED